MAITLRTCSWLLAALGVAMTAWLLPHPVAFIPYALFPFAIIAARRCAARAIVLIVVLASVSMSFLVFWDARIRPSTMNMTEEVVIVETLIASVMWIALRRIERRSRPAETAIGDKVK